MAKATVTEVNDRIHTHEEVCALRYEAIHDRLDKLEAVLTKALWTTVTFMAGGLGTLLVILIKG